MYKLIKLQEKFILVSDEKITNGFIYIPKDGIIMEQVGVPCNEEYKKSVRIFSNKGHRKIIAGIKELPSIDFSLLSEEDCKTIGWVDVEKLAKEIVINNNTNGAENFSMSVFNGLVKDITNSFKTAQSLNNKMFSLEDVRKLASAAFTIKSNNETLIEDFDNWFNKHIQSLQQTSWNVEVEMEEHCKPMPNIHVKCYEPKITNNQIKVIKLL